MSDLRKAIIREANEAKLSDVDGYYGEVTTMLREEVIRQYQEIKLLKIQLGFSRATCETLNELVKDMIEIITARAVKQ